MNQRKPKRIKISKATESRVLAFYEGWSPNGFKCVITDSDVEVELHHLDENPSHSDDPFNLLPLKSDLNGSIEKRECRILDELLTDLALENRSNYYFARGRYPYAYGCSILGATLAFNKPWKSHRPVSYWVDAETAVAFGAMPLLT